MKDSLPDALRDWTPREVAGYLLAVAIGLMPDGIYATHAKHVFWSDDPVGAVLYQMLDQLVVLGVLDYRTEPDLEYRWNIAFRGSLEGAPWKPSN